MNNFLVVHTKNGEVVYYQRESGCSGWEAAFRNFCHYFGFEPSEEDLENGGVELDGGDTIWMVNMPIEVFKAILHVRKFHPTASMVVYNKETRWQFMGEDFERIKFGDEIDIGILEEAQDVIHIFPSVYQL